jgi:hypothetical protein
MCNLLKNIHIYILAETNILAENNSNHFFLRFSGLGLVWNPVFLGVIGRGLGSGIG